MRGLAPPRPVGSALKIETGLPHERRRYIFLRPPEGINALAVTVGQPTILLKAAMDAADMAGLLPSCWHVEQTGTTMTAAALAFTPLTPLAGLARESVWRGPVYSVRIVDKDGMEAARGRMTVIDGWALHDNIVVAESNRRQGLGTAIMAALANEALDQGISHGLLNATMAGRALYERLGWVARAPWTTAQIML